VQFVLNTHYIFSSGKDKLLKYWDLDRNELLLEMPGHQGEVWCLAVSAYGDFVMSGEGGRPGWRGPGAVCPWGMRGAALHLGVAAQPLLLQAHHHHYHHHTLSAP
jgi:hypothetical protein